MILSFIEINYIRAYKIIINMKHKLFVLILVASAICGYSQERCGTAAITQQRIEKYNDYKKARNKVNTQTEKWIKEHPNYNPKTIITIPVVVHVVWRTNNQNISDTQIQSQIDILNADFNRTNIDALNTPNIWKNIAADCEIEFCLANIDPSGNPTTGITRTQTNTNQFQMSGPSVADASSGGKEPWDVNHYLNMWVCNLGGGLLGYASQPSDVLSSNDGVVINYTNFGNSGSSNTPYHKGRTATHEVGHWLNLDHIWGDNNCGNDHITDTPKQEEDNTGCPGFPHNANSCNTSNNNGDMFMNYMDYTNDQCMNLFTEGQETRMLAAINEYRPNILTNSLCSVTTSILEITANKKALLKIVDVLGRVTNKQNKGNLLFYIYNDGSVEKKLTR